jgi:class 3 adenylate cyclase
MMNPMPYRYQTPTLFAAGDGLLVLFHSEDKTTHALEAVRTSLTIREKAALINREENACSECLIINTGINSGPVSVDLYGPRYGHQCGSADWCPCL